MVETTRRRPHMTGQQEECKEGTRRRTSHRGERHKGGTMWWGQQGKVNTNRGKQVGESKNGSRQDGDITVEVTGWRQ